MPQTSVRAAALLILLAGGAFVSETYGQTPERRAAQPTPSQPPQQETARELVARDVDAHTTRQQLIEVLRKHPPSVAQVIKLDPSLMRNESYLAAYPSLKDFLAQHPHIQQNSSYYLGQFDVDRHIWEPRNQRLEMVESTIIGVAVFVSCATVLGVLIWFFKTILDQRRWSRLSKIQAEVHSKLMDRFSSNDELLTYVQTPSGRRFLESGPSPLQEEQPRAIGAPFARILWSVQIGVVLLVGGLGLLYVSTRTFEEAKEFFFIIGVVAMALGAGFTVSAAASYVLSRKLGLFEKPTADHA
jgi:hypothetical protein